MVYGETGHIQLSLIAESRMLSYWCKMAYSKTQHKFTHVFLKLMNALNEKGQLEFKWGNKVRNLLNSYGLGGLWDTSANDISVEWFRRALDLRISDTSRQNWASEVAQHASCTCYRMFKEEFTFEKQLLDIDSKLAKVMIQFRCANFPIPARKNRFTSHATSSECEKCHREIGDEFHYLLVCPFFNKIRKKFIPALYLTAPNCLKFKNLISTTNTVRPR